MMKNWLPIWTLLVGAAVLSAGCAPAAAPSKPSSSAPLKQEAQAPSSQGATAGSVAPGGAAPPAVGQKAIVDRMILYESKVYMEVKDATETLDAIANIARKSGGYVVSNSFQLQGDRKVAVVTIRVPSKTYDETLSELRRLALKVESEDSKSQDVTEEYSDLNAQLRNLEATESQSL